MDSILILGGGTMQLPAIHAARRLGLRLYVVDADPTAPGARLADRFEAIDLKAREEIARYAAGIPGLRGVFTAGTDFSRSVAHVAETLRLPGISEAVAINATEKGLMRQRFLEAGVPSPRFALIPPEEATVSAAERVAAVVGYPGVVKPVDNMGSRGVRTVERLKELSPAIEEARRFAREGRVIYEERILGREFSVDALVYRGELHLTGLADRHIFFSPFFVEMGHTLPAAVSEAEESAIRAAFAAGVRALGINNGAAKGDIFLREDGSAAVGEIAARLSGGYMSGWTYPYATGVPLTEAAIRLALGDDPTPHLEADKSETSVERAFISIPGIVDRVEGSERVRELPGVRELFLRVAPGTAVAPPRNNVEKCGNLILTGADRDEAISRAAAALRGITVRLRAGVERTERYLFGGGEVYPWAPYPELLSGHHLPGTEAVPELRRWRERSLSAGSLLLPPGGLRRLEESGNRAPSGPPGGVAFTADPGHHWSGFSLAAALNALERRRFLRESPEAAPAAYELLRRALALGGVQGVVYIWDTVTETAGAAALERWVSRGEG